MGNLLSSLEEEYALHRPIPPNQRGILKKRIRDKLLSLNKEAAAEAILFLTEEELVLVMDNLISHLPIKFLAPFFRERLSNINRAEKVMRDSSSSLTNLQKRVSRIAKIGLNMKEAFTLLDKENILKNQTKLKKEINKIINAPSFVLNRKFWIDRKFMEKSTNNLKIIERLTSNKPRVVKLNELVFNKADKHYVEELFCRGIILSIDTSKEKFLKKSREGIFSKKLTYIFKFPGFERNPRVKFNSFYKPLLIELKKKASS